MARSYPRSLYDRLISHSKFRKSKDDPTVTSAQATRNSLKNLWPESKKSLKDGDEEFWFLFPNEGSELGCDQPSISQLQLGQKPKGNNS